MSDDIAIRVQGLGKKYKISHETAAYRTLGETITNAIKRPVRRLRGEMPSRSTEDFWALKDVSFEVKKGEVIGIIGRNGAGKSTLLKILSRITTPTEGTIEVHGRIGSLLEVGTGFHPELSGRENIYLSGSILGMKRNEIDAKFDEIVRFAEMEKFLDTPVKRYSSGMYVRLAFAIAAHLEPEILIVDEVLAVGDTAFQKKSLGKMGDVASKGKTVLFVSHNLHIMRSLCTQGILLNDGKIAETGDINKVVNSYSTKFFSISNLRSPNELGNKIAWLETIWMASCDSGSGAQQKNIFRIDEPAKIFFKIRSNEALDEINVGFSIHDEIGDSVCVVYSAPDTYFSVKPGDNVISVQIPNLSITPGRYSIRFRIEQQSPEISRELDWPKGDLFEFEILPPTDIDGIRPETIKNGMIVLHPKWSREGC